VRDRVTSPLPSRLAEYIACRVVGRVDRDFVDENALD
jgi:hypothetical protein